MGGFSKFAVAVILLISIFYNRKFSRELKDLRGRTARQSETIKKLKGFLAQDASAEREAIDKLKVELANEQSALLETQANLQKWGDSPANGPSSTVDEEIRARADDLNDLQRQLQEVKNAQASVSAQQKYIEAQERANRQQGSEGIRARVRSQEQFVSDLRRQYRTQRQYNFGTTPEQMNQLRQQIADQESALSALREQERSVGATYASQVGTTERQASAAQADIRNRGQNLRSRILTERAAYQELLRQKQSLKNNADAWSENSKKLHAEEHDENERIQQLTGELKAHEDRLAVMGSI